MVSWSSVNILKISIIAYDLAAVIALLEESYQGYSREQDFLGEIATALDNVARLERV